MKTSPILLICAFLCTVTSAQEGLHMSPEEATHVLNSPETPARTAMEAARVIADSAGPGDYAMWSQLRPTLALSSLPSEARILLFRAFIDNADRRIAGEMLSMALRWSNENMDDVVGRAPDEEWRAEWNDRSSVILVPVFFAALSDPPIRELVGSSEEALQFIRNVALGAGISSDSRSEAILTLRDSPVSAERRAEIAANIVAADHSNVSPHPVLLSLLQSRSIPRFRSLLAQSEPTRETLHWAAMAALAHLGDLESRELILAKGRALARSDPGAPDIADYYLWKIDVQQPPEQLLEFIAQPEGPFHLHGHLFAIRRAAELGLPKDQIRAAILRHAENTPVQRRRDVKGRVVTWRDGLSNIKSLGLELGILRDGDLPGVPDPAAGIHH